MSIKIISKIYNDLKETFNQYEIYDTEIDLIKDIIVFEGDANDTKVNYHFLFTFSLSAIQM